MSSDRKSLKLVSCPACGCRVFIPADTQPLKTAPCPKCQHAVMMPWQLRQFELRSEIASGGMGTVYRAWDTTLGREVAVKLMKQELASDDSAVNGFAREARACAGLNHTNIIAIYTFDREGADRYLVMELADQGSLDDRLERGGRLAELDVLDVGIKVAGALNVAFKHGLLHLDIKPGNILFGADNEPKVVDFGLAKRTDAEKEYGVPIFGTPYYVAPERIEQKGDSFLADMYSLAGTLYHCLIGHVPFDAPSIDDVVAAHLHTPLTPPIQLLPELSQATSDCLVRAMAKNPADRYPSYDEFIMALTATRSQLLIRRFAPQAAEGGATTRWWRR